MAPERRPDDDHPRSDASSSPRAAEGGGFGPSEIPDPMPQNLKERRDEVDEVEAMDGDSPTG